MYAMIAGGVDTGWTFYVPYSTHYSNTHVIATGLGIFITGFSSILTGLNFIVTIHKMRAPGLTWWRLPLFVWAHYATSLIMILGTPVIAVTMLMVALENGLHLGIFDPALGGDPILFQHLFWFYSHPAAYIMILPAMGVISELVQGMSRKHIFAYSFIAIVGLTGLFLDSRGLDVHLTDTYFIVAHFHYIMVGGAIMGYLGGLHYWWPKITGRLYPEAWGRVGAIIIFAGFNLTFGPQFILG